MGGEESKPVPEPMFSEPWRKLNWMDRQGILDYVKNYNPRTPEQVIRILLYGPVASGKSSFINSVNSLLRERPYINSLANHNSSNSFTRVYKTYRIHKGTSGAYYPFVFNDIMGLQNSGGVHPDDVKLALKGHVMENYEFNPESMLTEENQFYKQYPSEDDKVTVLVCVVDAHNMSIILDETLRMLRDIRKEASRLGIPQVAILTHIDEVCPEVKKDLKDVYKSILLKKKMEEFSAKVGIPMNCIFPVKNYHDEIDTNNDLDVLLLSALKNIIHFGEDYLNP
ncbi:Hypothetical predicted protein [Xyrichtys novacula]|uniref:G domain-containing protein n=1 Tax=Xyrichtys novacula TaxID=13765 RepID=A0AAV1GVE3_XYRNO|nr:Hypothetical predicted protein [Xyrichtys novacula]